MNLSAVLFIATINALAFLSAAQITVGASGGGSLDIAAGGGSQGSLSPSASEAPGRDQDLANAGKERGSVVEIGRKGFKNSNDKVKEFQASVRGEAGIGRDGLIVGLLDIASDDVRNKFATVAKGVTLIKSIF